MSKWRPLSVVAFVWKLPVTRKPTTFHYMCYQDLGRGKGLRRQDEDLKFREEHLEQTYPASGGYIFAVWAGVRKVASAGTPARISYRENVASARSVEQTRNYCQKENKSACSMKTKWTVESGDEKFVDNISNVCNIFTVFVSPLFVCMLFVIIQNLGSFNSR